MSSSVHPYDIFTFEVVFTGFHTASLIFIVLCLTRRTHVFVYSETDARLLIDINSTTLQEFEISFYKRTAIFTKDIVNITLL